MKVLAPSGAPLVNRITRSEASHWVALGIAEDVTESYRKQIGAIKMIASVVTPKDFGTDHFTSRLKSQHARTGTIGNDANATTVKQRGRVADFHRRSGGFRGVIRPVVQATKNPLPESSAVMTVGYYRSPRDERYAKNGRR